ncbi:DUF1801 domain-containing protein [Hyunsoonleella sp. 2307UL5-6]|uniref:DUF1801 domain-containing protein n=1 Tax=Hyunsoonleella sp. 2307UL5-6 TaxID=3384768 RepID=UPI0039BC383D
MNPAEEYILKQVEPYKSILLQLQAIIEAVIPNSEMLYKWRIPFFYNNGIPICFLNQSKDYVDLAFWHFESMDNYTECFVAGTRKSVRSLRYKSIADIDDTIIIYVLKKQLEVNTNPFKLILKARKK